MGCFSKRRGVVTHLPARFHILVIALCVRVTRPSRNVATNTLIRAGSFAGSFLPATRLVLPRAICKDRGIGGRGSDLSGAIKLRNVLDCQAKILEAVNGFGRICVVSTTSCHTSSLCQPTRDSKLQNR